MNLSLIVIREAIASHISTHFFLGNPDLLCRLMVNTADLHWIISFAAARSYLRFFRLATEGDEV